MLVLSLGQPYLVNDARTPGWDKISAAWRQAETSLRSMRSHHRAVVPGSGFAHEDWGWRLDEPLQLLGGVHPVTEPDPDHTR